MSGYLEGVLVILLLNVIFAYAVYWPLAAGQLNLGVGRVRGHRRLPVRIRQQRIRGVALAGLHRRRDGDVVVALVIAVPVLRTRGIYLALATFAFGQVLQSLFLNLEVVGGAAGYPVLTYIGIGGIAAFAFAVFLVTAFLERTRFGLNMVAVRDDEAVSDLFGVNVRRYQALAFAIGAAFAGLGGGLYGHHFSYIEPQNYRSCSVSPSSCSSFSAAPRPCSARCSAPSSSPCCRKCCAAARSGATRYSRS